MPAFISVNHLVAIPKIEQVYTTISAAVPKQNFADEHNRPICGVEEIHGCCAGPINGALAGADRSNIHVGSQHTSSRQTF